MLSFCNARQVISPESYIPCSPDALTPDVTVGDESTAGILRTFRLGFHDHVVRVLTVLPRVSGRPYAGRTYRYISR